MKEKDIIFEIGSYWIGKEKDCYTVFKTGLTHSTSDSSYHLNEDGLSIAIARCKYLAKRELKYTSDSNGVYCGKNTIAKVYVGEDGYEVRTKQGMNRERTINNIIALCPEFAKEYKLSPNKVYKLFS